MADPFAVCGAIAAQITAQTGLPAHGYAPGQTVPPCAVVIPGLPAITYARTMQPDYEVDLAIRAIVLVSGADDSYGQQKIAPFVASSGTSSILGAINSDNSLSGLVEFAQVISVNQYGFLEYAGQQYFGATFNITVGAHL